MDDPELAAIRAARLQQLKQQGGGSSGGRGSAPPGAPGTSGGGGEDDAQRAAQEDEMRRNLLATVLDGAARERLSRIALVSPERSRQIESILLRMAQSGQLKQRVSEDQLIGLLEQAEEANSKGGAKKGAIVYQRRRELDDDDDFDL